MKEFQKFLGRDYRAATVKACYERIKDKNPPDNKRWLTYLDFTGNR